MIKSILKLILWLVIIVLVILAYQTNGSVDMRISHWAISMSFATFSLLFFLTISCLFYAFILARYLQSISTKLKLYWSKKQERAGYACLEEGLAYLEGGQLNQAQKRAKKSMSLLPGNLLPKWLSLSTMKARGVALDSTIISDIVKSKTMGLLGYKYQIEQRIQDAGASEIELDLLKALKEHPQFSWLMKQLFESYIAQSNYLSAIEIGKKITTTSVNISPQIALCYFSLSKNTPEDRQIKYLKAAIELDVSHPEIALTLAKIYIKTKQFKKAQSVIESTWKYSQHPNLGKLYLNTISKPTSEERLSALLKLTNLAGESLVSLTLIIDECLHSELYQKARYYLDKAIQINGGMSQDLLLLRIALTKKDGAEKLDVENWVRHLVPRFYSSEWKCSNCNSQTPTWSENCKECGKLQTVRWITTRQNAPTIIHNEGV